MPANNIPGATISVAILSCNRRDDLRMTLEILKQSPRPWKEIIVADNASEDGTRDMLAADYPEVILLALKENKGVEGINQAYLQASGDWVLSLDDDSAPDCSTWAALYQALERGERAAVIALSVIAKKQERPALPQHTELSQLPQAYGFSQAGCLFNRQAIEELGGFDEKLFLWSVELHWVAKALTAGWTLARCDEAQVIHRSTPLNRSSQRHAYYYCRNLLLFLLQYAPDAIQAELIQNYLENALTYSLLHKTTTYLKAVGQAKQMQRQSAETYPKLTPELFTAICPDLRAPYSYLG